VICQATVLFLHEALMFEYKIQSNEKLKILHPFNSYVTTLPSFVFKLFTMLYLNDEEIYSIPNENVCVTNRVSRAEYEFVLYESSTNPDLTFFHAFSSKSGQKRFGPFFVDLYCSESKTIYQFHGCYYHGHLPPECKDKHRQNLTPANIKLPPKYKNVSEIENSKILFENYILQNHSDEVKSIKYIYECDWKLFKKSKSFISFRKKNATLLNRPLGRLHPRTAMRSGFLECYKLKYEQDKDPDKNFLFLMLMVYTATLL